MKRREFLNAAAITALGTNNAAVTQETTTNDSNQSNWDQVVEYINSRNNLKAEAEYKGGENFHSLSIDKDIAELLARKNIDGEKADPFTMFALGHGEDELFSEVENYLEKLTWATNAAIITNIDEETLAEENTTADITLEGEHSDIPVVMRYSETSPENHTNINQKSMKDLIYDVHKSDGLGKVPEFAKPPLDYGNDDFRWLAQSIYVSDNLDQKTASFKHTTLEDLASQQNPSFNGKEYTVDINNREDGVEIIVNGEKGVYHDGDQVDVGGATATVHEGLDYIDNGVALNFGGSTVTNSYLPQLGNLSADESQNLGNHI